MISVILRCIDSRLSGHLRTSQDIARQSRSPTFPKLSANSFSLITPSVFVSKAKNISPMASSGTACSSSIALKVEYVMRNLPLDASAMPRRAISRQTQAPLALYSPWTFCRPWSPSAAGFVSFARPMIFAGAPTCAYWVGRPRSSNSTQTPTAVAPDGIGLSTTAPQPSFAPSPIRMFPSTETLAPSSTFFPIFGWRSPPTLPVAPSVTPCNIVHPSPRCAVSPMTTPVAWSMTTAGPIVAAGWMSTPNAADARLWSHSAKDRSPRSHARFATR
mmetsp:Transcript_5291/g.16417  ORF Transcript_5291/g.16417 Transcript_5291/m.16417 type:complete len:274 (-) Transcript_5291:134-955(-)